MGQPFPAPGIAGFLSYRYNIQLRWPAFRAAAPTTNGYTNIMTRRILLPATALALATLAGSAFAQPAAPAARIRGTITAVDGHTLTLKTRAGDTVTVRLTDDVKVVGALPATVADIKPGLFIGTASIPGPDDSQQAMEVTLFPASMNGTGEGSFAWDLGANSTMTNGTIGDITDAHGRTMTVKYKDNERRITIPDDIPVVLLDPAADFSIVKTGAAVVVAPTKAPDGSLAAARITVGENGTVPPM